MYTFVTLTFEAYNRYFQGKSKDATVTFQLCLILDCDFSFLYNPWPGLDPHLYPPAGLVDVPVEPRLDLVVGEEGHIAGVGHGQDLPVPQEAGPGLE